MKDKIRVYQVDEAWTPQYPVALEVSASDVESRIGGVRGKVAKAKLVIREKGEVLRTLALTQGEIERLISALRSAQQRMEPISTRIPLGLKQSFIAKGMELGKSPSEYLRELIEREVQE